MSATLAFHRGFTHDLQKRVRCLTSLDKGRAWLTSSEEKRSREKLNHSRWQADDLEVSC